MNYKNRNLLTILLSSFFFMACQFNLEKVEAPVDKTLAKKFSDSLVTQVISEDHKKIYENMDDAFQKQFPEETIPETLNKIDDVFGKTLRANYKTDEVGFWIYENGARKAMRKVWYSVVTDKAGSDPIFLYVVVVLDNGKPGCAKFALVKFPQGIPDNLK